MLHAPSSHWTPLTSAALLALALSAPAQGNGGGAETTDGDTEQQVVPVKTPPASRSEEIDLRVFWKNGLRFEDKDKSFKLKIGGRLQNDYWFVTNESPGLENELEGRLLRRDDGTEFRRARINMSGTISDMVIFKWSYDFAGALASFKDAYIGLKDLGPLGTVTVGQQKEPIGLEFAYSSNAATFMERGLPHSLNPERNTGIRFQRTAADEAVYLTGGLYRLTNSQGNSGPLNDGWSAAARASWAPIYEDKGRKLLHLGISGSRREKLSIYAKGSRPSINGMQPYVLSTVTNVDNVTSAGLEAAANLGPLSFQAEYNLNVIERNSGNRADWSGWYAYVSWFLTGEHRPYRRDKGAFAAVTPNTNLTKDGGGAWEIAARFSSLDIADENNSTTVGGGRLQDITAGLNWYMNYNTRLMFNYVHADLQGIGASDAIAMRLQVFF